MYTKEELIQMTKQAKEKLEGNNQEVDLYAEFRDELNEVSQGENIYVEDSVSEDIPKSASGANKEESESFSLKYEMDEDEYMLQEEVMKEASIQNVEELVYEKGPTVSEVNGWKKKYAGARIYAVRVLDEMFTFRTLNRFEYKQLIRQANIDASQREEVICETTVLHPHNYNWRTMAKKEAGIPSTLSEIIMQKSGFTDEFYIERL